VQPSVRRGARRSPVQWGLRARHLSRRSRDELQRASGTMVRGRPDGGDREHAPWRRDPGGNLSVRRPGYKVGPATSYRCARERCAGESTWGRRILTLAASSAEQWVPSGRFGPPAIRGSRSRSRVVGPGGWTALWYLTGRLRLTGSTPDFPGGTTVRTSVFRHGSVEFESTSSPRMPCVRCRRVAPKPQKAGHDGRDPTDAARRYRASDRL
jgi:hypothetical protein